MAETQKIWNKHKITAIVIMLIAIAVVFSIYIELDYPAINHPKILEKSISNVISGQDVQAKIVQVDKHDKLLFVTFTDERYPNFMGVATFQREIDLLWHPINASYGNALTIAESYRSSENNSQTIIYGINTDPRIAYYEGMNYGQESTYTKNVTSPDFIDYCENGLLDRGLNLFDKDGNDITLELKARADNSGPEGSVSYERTFFGNWGMYVILLLASCILTIIFWSGNKNPIVYSKIKDEQKEKRSGGFITRLKKMDKKKKIALSILMITVVAAIAFYSAFYSTFSSESDLKKAIEGTTGDSNITLLKTETEGNHLIALYATGEPHTRGIVIFEQGWNGLLAPVEYYKASDICIAYFWKNFHLGKEYYFMVSGLDCDPRAVSYEYVYEDTDIGRAPITIYSNEISEPNFIHIYKMDKRYPNKLNIYDSTGNNIEPELTRKIREENIEFVNQGESHEMFYEKAIPIFIILIGFLAAWWLWIGNERQREG